MTYKQTSITTGSEKEQSIGTVIFITLASEVGRYIRTQRESSSSRVTVTRLMCSMSANGTGCKYTKASEATTMIS